MPRPRDSAQTARLQRLQTLVHDLGSAQRVDTPASRAIADGIKRDIEAVYRAAGFHYPAIVPLDRDHAAGRVAHIQIVRDELRLTMRDLTEIVAQTTARARHNLTKSRETVKRARVTKAGKKR